MKFYSTSFIRNYIEKNKESIEQVEIGMKEDWSWTADDCYKDGKYLMNLSEKKVKVKGINGSIWATPCMRVTFKDGTKQVIDCYSDDGDKASEADIREKIAFAKATGGCDLVR